MDTTMFQRTVIYSGDYIFIQPLCDFFGINYENQRRVIARNKIIKTSAIKKSSMLLFGDERERIAVTKRGFISWVLQINDQIVHPNLREKLVEYQTYILDYMYGSLERESQLRQKYAHLRQLRHSYGHIGNEIQRINRDMSDYLEERFGQTNLFATSSRVVGLGKQIADAIEQSIEGDNSHPRLSNN